MYKAKELIQSTSTKSRRFSTTPSRNYSFKASTPSKPEPPKNDTEAKSLSPQDKDMIRIMVQRKISEKSW